MKEWFVSASFIVLWVGYSVFFMERHYMIYSLLTLAGAILLALLIVWIDYRRDLKRWQRRKGSLYRLSPSKERANER